VVVTHPHISAHVSLAGRAWVVRIQTVLQVTLIYALDMETVTLVHLQSHLFASVMLAGLVILMNRCLKTAGYYIN
jgi:hypothetical protein